MRLFERNTLKEIVLVFAGIAGVAAVLLIARPLLVSLGNYNLIVFFIGEREIANGVINEGYSGASIVGIGYFTSHWFFLDYTSSTVGWK